MALALFNTSITFAFFSSREVCVMGLHLFIRGCGKKHTRKGMGQGMVKETSSTVMLSRFRTVCG